MAKATADEDDDTIMEEREDLMLPLSSAPGAPPTLRISHFLKPSSTTTVNNLIPSPSLSSSSTTNKLPLKLSFNGWRINPFPKWNKWVNQMQSLHKSTWSKAGIENAIINSTFTITRNENLILAFTEKWCSETNTFLFPFGECTITLQDIFILGGFSVLGHSVFDTQTQDDIIEMKFEQARLELGQSKTKKATHPNWMEKFMGSGSKIEHEAFLVLWLWMFIFPSSSLNTVKNYVYPIAICLSKGIQVAFAPFILANIYRDLTLLEKAMVKCTKSQDEIVVTLCASFQLVQVCIWERFPTISPKPNSITNIESRLARWHKLKHVMKNIDNVRLALGSASTHFCWRPYSCKFEGWVSFDCDDEELVALARCLRPSELVGLDCIEQYLPHRTAMQFGFDQDIPGDVARANGSSILAWRNYTRPIADKSLHFGSKLFKAEVTTRYFEWWNENFKSGSTRSKIQCTSDRKKDNDALVPPGFRPKFSAVKGNDSKSPMDSSVQILGSSDSDSKIVQEVESSVSMQEESVKIVSDATENEGNRVSANNAEQNRGFLNMNEPQKTATNLKNRVIILEKKIASLKAAMASNIG